MHQMYNDVIMNELNFQGQQMFWSPTTKKYLPCASLTSSLESHIHRQMWLYNAKYFVQNPRLSSTMYLDTIPAYGFEVSQQDIIPWSSIGQHAWIGPHISNSSTTWRTRWGMMSQIPSGKYISNKYMVSTLYICKFDISLLFITFAQILWNTFLSCIISSCGPFFIQCHIATRSTCWISIWWSWDFNLAIFFSQCALSITSYIQRGLLC